VRTFGALVGIVLLVGGLRIERIAGHGLAAAARREARAGHKAGGEPAARDAAWTIETNVPGTATIRYRNVEVGSFRYAFWGKGFAWADPEVKAAPSAARPQEDAFSVAVPSLGMKIRGAVRRGPNALVWQYSVETAASAEDVVGGGLEFNLKLDAPVLDGRASDVTLRPDNRGFDWTLAGGSPLSVVFDQPLASVYLERGQKQQIRCFFDADRLVVGKRSWTMTIQLPPGGQVQRSIAARYGSDDRTSWTPDTIVWNQWPIDVGFLNDGDRPAGSHGRVAARGDQLVFADGTVARFWGTNVAASALFTGTKTEVANQAKRIAALGYNLVRIHHHDSSWVSPNVFAAGDTTQVLDDAALDAINWWVKCLRDEGVYVWLDLKVGRTFRAGDGVPAFAELTKTDPQGRGFDYVDPRLEELEQGFARQYLTRVNRYTGRSYLDDPAIVAALVTNEDDLTTHFGNAMLPDHQNPVHQGMLRAAIETSAAQLGVPMRQALRSWEPGPAKLVLADVEARFFQRARSQLRGLGFGGLVVGTSSWGSESLYSLASLATGDLVDVHAYGEVESLSVDPRFEPNFISWIGAAQLAGKPLSISEWNVEYPKRDRFTAPLYVAAVADLQGWDAPMLFNYTQDKVGAPIGVQTWSTAYDPAITALMPAAAVMFRQQHVRQALRTMCFHPTSEALYGTELSPNNSAALRTIVEQSRLVVALPNIPQLAWDDDAGLPSGCTEVVTDPDRDFLGATATTVRSDTGELERDWGAGVETIDTPLTQAAVGWIGGRSISLRDVDIRIDTPKAAVALTSLDGRPIGVSAKVLLTVVGQVAASPGNVVPFLAQPVAGSIVLRSSQARLTMIPLSPTAHPDPTAAGPRPGLEPIAARLAPAVRGGRAGQLFALPRKPATHWWLLQPAASSPPR
jgi:hypothetical protein